MVGLPQWSLGFVVWHLLLLMGAAGIAHISLGVRKLLLDKTIIEMATIFFSVLGLDSRGLVQAKQVFYHQATSSLL